MPLPFFLHGPPRNLALGTAFHRAGVHSNFLDPTQVERTSRIRLERTSAKNCSRSSGVRRLVSFTRRFVSCCGMVVIYRHGIRLTSRRERNHESGCRAVIVRQETLQREFTECFDAEVISTLPKKKR